MPLTLTEGDIMNQLTQLPIDQYNEHMRLGEAMLPVDVIENTEFIKIDAGEWFSYNGVIYLRATSFFYNAVSQFGTMAKFNDSDKVKPINVVISEFI